MIDKDLENLLSDVNDVDDFTIQRKESLLQKQRHGGKGDRSTEKEDGDINHDGIFLENIKKLDLQDDVLKFKYGVAQAINEHHTKTQSFQRTINDVVSPPSLVDRLKQYKYAFSRCLENIDKYYDDYLAIFNMDSLHKSVNKDYNLFFEGFVEENKLDFLILKEIFIRLREFNSKIKKEWSDLEREIGVINLTAEGKSLFQFLNNIVVSALNFCETTDKFLGKLSVVLSISEGDYDVTLKEINNKIKYHDNFLYKYDSIKIITAELQLNIIKVINGTPKTSAICEK